MRYIVICGLSSCTIFFRLSHNQHDLKKKILNTNCVFWFSVQLLSETFLILRRNEQDNDQKFMSVFMYSARYSFQILLTLEFSWQVFTENTQM